MNNIPNYQSNTIEDFWGELAPVDSSIQLYANDVVFLKTLETFVRAGLRVGDTVIVITTQAHRSALERRLETRGIDLGKAKVRGQYIALDARTILSTFMVDGLLDEALFKHFVTELLDRAHRNGSRVRAFGEIVALLWMQGHREATILLEKLWTRFCEEEALCLFCAYPASGVTQTLSVSIAEICAAHSKIFSEQSPHLVGYESEAVATLEVIEPIKIWGDLLVAQLAAAPNPQAR